jgi:hypothetical protein
VAIPLDQVGDADEPGHEGRLRTLVHVDRVVDLLDAAAVEHRDPVAHRQRLFLVVRDVDERDAHLALDPEEFELHFLAELEIECAERLVEQQHLGFVDDRPGERDALALTAGELGRLAAAEPGQADHLQRAVYLLASFGLPDVPHAEAVLDVLADRHVRKQRVVLEHGVDVPVVRRNARDVGAAQLDPAGLGALEPGDQPQQGGLPRPGRAQQGEELTGPHGQFHIGERDHIAVPFPQTHDIHGCRRGSRITCSGGLHRAWNGHHSARCTTVQLGAATHAAPGVAVARTPAGPGSAGSRVRPCDRGSGGHHDRPERGHDRDDAVGQVAGHA